MAHETAVHRADAESAHGEIAPVVPAALASDGVDEVLWTMLSRLRNARPGNGETVHLHCTDTEGEWLLTLQPDRVDVRDGHARADCAARGAASDLLLFVWGRLPAARLEVLGDGDLLARVRRLAVEATQ
jgi:predicted lipid carrier protein YhbT